MALGSSQTLIKMRTRNIPGGKAGRCVRLTTSPSSRAEYHDILEPKPPGTLWATPDLLRDCFTFTMLNTVFAESHNKMKDMPVFLRNCLVSEKKYDVKCATLECKVHIRRSVLSAKDRILSRDRNVIFLARPKWRNVRTVFKFRFSYEHGKAQFTGIVIWSQVVTMAKSCRKCWFQSRIFLMVIILCIICVRESRCTTRSPATTTVEDRADPQIIDVPLRKSQNNCVQGRKKDKYGNCRTVWP